MITEIEAPVPGDRVNVAAAQYAFGPSFLAGPGTVLENRDVMSRDRKEILIRFDRGVSGRFKEDALKPLLIPALLGESR